MPRAGPSNQGSGRGRLRHRARARARARPPRAPTRWETGGRASRARRRRLGVEGCGRVRRVMGVFGHEGASVDRERASGKHSTRGPEDAGRDAASAMRKRSAARGPAPSRREGAWPRSLSASGPGEGTSLRFTTRPPSGSACASAQGHPMGPLRPSPSSAPSLAPGACPTFASHVCFAPVPPCCLADSPSSVPRRQARRPHGP